MKGGYLNNYMVDFKKVTAVATSLLMTGLTIGTAVAANYPAPFVTNGAADVAIVYGASAALDQVQATNIQTDLSKYVTSTGPTTITGESFFLGKSSNQIHVGDRINVAYTTLDDEDLPLVLADGSYRNDENTEFKYTQKITLGSFASSHFADSNYNNKEPTIGFHLSSNTPILNYTLDFSSDAESDVSSGDLVDLETTEIEILGKTYYILNADNGTNIKLTLLDSANSVVLNEGETVTVDVGGKSYVVSISSLTTTQAKLVVNGKTTNELTTTSDPYEVDDDVYIGLKSIFQRDVAGVVGNVEFSIGKGKLEIENDQEVELNDVDVDGLKGYITAATASGGKNKIDKITLEWKTDEEQFLTPGAELVLPGFEAVKFTMGEMTTGDQETVKVDYSGDDTIELTVPIKDGTATIPILHANSTGEFYMIGSDNDERLAMPSGAGNGTLFFYETNNSDNHDRYFVATYNTTSDAESYLLSAKITEKDAKNRTTIKNEVTGVEVCVDKSAGDTCDIGDVVLNIVEVYKTSTTEWVHLTAGTNVNFNTIYTAGGLKIYLPFETAANVTTKGAVNFSDTNAMTTTNAGHTSDSFVLYMTEENKDGDKAAGNTFNVTLNDNTDGKVHVTDVDTGSTDRDIPGTNDDTESVVAGELATKVKRIVTSDKGKAEIIYNSDETYLNVYVAEADAVSSSTTSGVVMVKDSEVSSVNDKNLIVVGGSCINSAAAALVGGAYCGESWTAATNVGANQYLIKGYASSSLTSKMALLVAGYEAADTAAAATYLTTQTVDTSSEIIGPQ